MNAEKGTLPVIEVFNTDNFFIFVKNEHSLWWDKATGLFYSKPARELPASSPPQCIGTCYGIIGKVQLPNVLETKVLVIKQCTDIGHGICKIKTIAFLQPSTPEAQPSLNICSKHQLNVLNIKPGDQKSPFAKTLGVMRSASNSIKTSTQQAAKIISRDNKVERRMMEELNKIFNDTDSFYFSLTSDLTNSIERQCHVPDNSPVWQNVDERFFWNKHMVQDLININSPFCDPWVLPIIQGFVETQKCCLETGFDLPIPESDFKEIELTVISRRSRHRAGTRYKRRGVDEDGHCANYVETEQVLRFQHHIVSFVQIRGSVPVFWSQPGYKYRPPPTLLRGPAETQAVFNKHFKQEQEKYGPIVAVNLVEQGGKERVIWDAYTNHILSYNDPNVTYCTFDFHEYCRGMRFENVAYLVVSLADILKQMGYCWVDKEGLICQQKGVFRVNCIDCLDRTNVVQTALGKVVLEMQLTKLGLLPPEGQLPSEMRAIFQQLWANSGDVISRQYAGTNALKGDYTRTGERKLSGLMKDGMNSANRYLLVHLRDSYRQAAIDITQGIQPDPIDTLNVIAAETREIVEAVLPEDVPSSSSISHVALGPEMQFFNLLCLSSRYYLSRFKDAHRQATIDIMLGHEVSEDVFADKATDDEDAAATAEHVKLLLDDCKKLLINEPNEILGCWGLIDADLVTGDPSETEMDTILILTKYAYYVAEYDEQVDRVSKYQRVSLRDIRLIEVGSQGVSAPLSVFKKQNAPHCLRIHYAVENDVGYFHTFRSTGLRFFNNVAVQINSPDEMLESLKAISETFLVALEVACLPAVTVNQGKPLERMKSKILPADNACRVGSYLEVRSAQNLTRNVSETQLVNLKSAGTKALSNISQQFSKMGRLGQSFRRSNKPRDLPDVKPPVFSIEPVEENETSPSSDSTDSPLGRPISNLRNRHWYLPSVGLLMSDAPGIDINAGKYPFQHAKTQAAFDPHLLTESRKKADIQKKTKLETPVQEKRLSHSAENMDDPIDRIAIPRNLNLNLEKRSSSEKNLSLNLATSQSESALKAITANLANAIYSPASATKDMLSPLSKIAKGVHSFGANLDPRKLKNENSYRNSEAHLVEIKLLEERWSGCSVKLIAL